MYEKVRISASALASQANCDAFLEIFQREQCALIEMKCDVHDAYSASSQFITHLTGRVLGQLDLHPTPIDTTGFKSVLNLIDTTCRDSYDLFYGLYKYNHRNATELLTRLHSALRQTERRLKLMDDNNKAIIEHKEANTTTRPIEQKIGHLVSSITESKTVELHALTQKLKRESPDLDIVSLCVGEADYEPHPNVLEATIAAVKSGKTKYTPVAGLECLRVAITRYLDQDKGVVYDPGTEVLVTNGAKQAVYQALVSICDPGDEVIVPSPYWVSYPEIVRLARGTPVTLDTSRTSYRLTPALLRLHLSPTTRAVILCNPSNPTGVLLAREELEAIAKVLQEPPYRHICVVSDEIYERVEYQDQTHVCFASLDGMRDRTLVVNGFSKGFAMTGYRLGYCAGPAHVIRAMTRLQGQLTSCASSLSQYAGLEALSLAPAEARVYRESIVNQMRTKRDYVMTQLTLMPEIDVVPGEGAFYLFPSIARVLGKSRPPVGSQVKIHDSADFCLYLLEVYHTALVPGTAFGQRDGIRIVYAADMDKLIRAMEDLKQALASLV